MSAGAVRLTALCLWVLALSVPAVGATAPTLGECEALLRTLPGERAGPKCLFEAGRAGALEEAEARLRRLIEEDPQDPWSYRYLGNVLWYARQAGKEEAYRRAGDLFAARGASAFEVESRYSLVVAILRRRPASGGADAMAAWRSELDEVLAQGAAAAAGDNDRVARAWLEMATARVIWKTAEDLDGAYQRLLAAEEMLTSSAADDAAGAEVACLSLLAQVAYELGRRDEAEQWVGRRLERARRAGDAWETAEAAYNQAAVVTQRLPGIAATAQEIENLLIEAIEGARDSRRRDVEALALLLLGKLVGGSTGIGHLRQCIQLAESLGSRTLQHDCALGLAALRVDDEPDAALDLLTRAEIELAPDASDPWGSIYGWEDRLHVIWETRPPEEALAASRTVLGAIEALRDEQTASGQPRVLDAWAEAYYWLAGRLLELHAERGGDNALRDAFAVVERLRAQVLRESLHSSGIDQPDGPEPAADLLDRLQRELAGDEALLSFQFFQDETYYGSFAGGSWLTATTVSGTRSYRLRGRTGLEPRIGSFLARPDPTAASAELGLLYDELLRSAVDDLPDAVRHLVIVPDGILHLIPFAALRATVDGVPLAGRFDLTIAPSAALWLDWRRQPPSETAGAGALVLAAPALPEGSDSIAAATRGRSADLRHAPREGRSVLRSLAGSRLLLRVDASEAALRSGLGGFSVLHVAAHAVVDEAEPSRSAIWLAAAGDDDGRLYPAEIAALEGLEGSLVVLAACSGSGGALLRGEGVMSLARAFFEAGAPTVVASLRPLRDDHAAELFDDFYRFLRRGLSVRAALAATQRQHLEGGVPAEAWANLVVLGNGDLVPVPAESGRPAGLTELSWDALLGLAGLPLALVFVGLALWRWRRRTRPG